MVRRSILLLAVVALLGALSVPVFRSASVKAAPAPAAAAAMPDRHPEYHDALEALRNARRHLQKAEADGYGHRDRAMHAIDAAIDDCNEALEVLH